jgi:hypothetical protein
MTNKKQELRMLVDDEMRAFWNIKCNIIDCCPICQGTDLSCRCYATYGKLWQYATDAAYPKDYCAEELRLPPSTTWGDLFRKKYPDRRVKSEILARKVMINQLPIEAYDKAVAKPGVKQEDTPWKHGAYNYGGK